MAQPKLNFTEQRLEAFPTRIFRREFEGLEDFNARMKRIILDKEGSSEGALVRSNVGGWHSQSDLFKWKHPEIEVLVQLFHAALLDYVAVETNQDPESFELVVGLDGWANVSRAGNYAKAHVHPMSNLALVYYVDVGDHEAQGRDDISGTIEFLDPRNRANMFASPGTDPRDSLLSRPRDGVLLVFPSWLYHTVHPYRGKRPRISIAANATIQELRAKKDQPLADGGRPAAKIIEEQ